MSSLNLRTLLKRLIDVLNPNGKTIDALKHLDLPAGVDIELKNLVYCFP